MTHAYRTLTRCIGYAGLVGGILAGTSTLVHAQDYPPYYSQASRVHIAATYARQQSIASGTAVVPVNTRARWTSPDGSISRYRTSTINVPKSTLRIGALASMSRGIMHPGFQIALAAAGYLYLNGNIYEPASSIDGEFSVDYQSLVDYAESNSLQIRHTWSNNTTISSPSCGFTPSGSAIVTSSSGFIDDITSSLNGYLAHIVEYDGSGHPILCWKIQTQSGPNRYQSNRLSLHLGPVSSYPSIDNDSLIDIDPADIDDSIDPYIPPSLYDELWNGEPIPEWQDTISVLGSPATGVSADGALAPELADAVGRWGENMDAQYNGDEAPHADHPTTGNTAQDQAAEEVLDGEVPPFPDLDIEWQTETLELPSYSSGIGAGSCPAGVTIPLPLAANPLQFSYQPACDLATMVRPALIGICGLIALMIVLRARGGA